MIKSLEKIRKKYEKIQEFIELIVIDSMNKMWIPDDSFLLIKIFRNFKIVWSILLKKFCDIFNNDRKSLYILTVSQNIFAFRFWAH